MPWDERIQFDARALAHLESAFERGSPWIAFSRRLAELFAAEGHLPVGFVDIVRSALLEWGVDGPYRLVATNSAGAEQIVSGIGVSVENFDEIARSRGVGEAAQHLREVSLALAWHVAGLAESEFSVVDEAVRSKYDGLTADAANEDTGENTDDMKRATASIVAQYAEARTRESLGADASEQIALFIDALLRRDRDLVFRLEPLVVALEPLADVAAGSSAMDPKPAVLPPVVEISIDRPAPEANPPAPIAVPIPLVPIPRYLGVVYSRDPALGNKRLLIAAHKAGGDDRVLDGRALAREAPELISELAHRCAEFEARTRAAVCATFEANGPHLESFTPIPRDASRLSELTTAVAMVHEGRLSRSDALSRLDSLDLTRIRHRGVLTDGVLEPIAQCEIVSPGASSGRLALSGRQALAYRRCGSEVVLAIDSRQANESNMLDLAAVQGVLVLQGDTASPLARAARRLDVPALATYQLLLDAAAGLVFGERGILREGEVITLDAASGSLYAGDMPIVDLPPPAPKAELHAWRMAEAAASKAQVQLS